MGLGGIGGTLAGHLLEQDLPVTSVSTNERIREAIDRSGFLLSGEGETRVVRGRVLPSPPTDERFDYILLATQPPQVEAAAEAAAPCLSDQGRMVVFQNGLCEERIAQLVDAKRIIGAVVAWGASMIGPGQYERTSAGGFTLGRLEGPPDQATQTLALLLESIGPVDLTDNLRGARWSKLAINCAISSLGTVGGDRLGALIVHRFVRRLTLEIMTEVVQIAHAERVRLEKVSGTLDLEWIALSDADRKSSGSPSLLSKHTLLLAVGARYRRLRSSMLSAIERGRTPAVDFLNGEIVTRGEKYGIGTPINRRVRDTIHAIARGEAKSSLELLRRLYDETR
jgi:2-dehydropantoate 2-reductase